MSRFQSNSRPAEKKNKIKNKNKNKQKNVYFRYPKVNEPLKLLSRSISPSARGVVWLT